MIATLHAIISGLLADRRVRTIIGLAAVTAGTGMLRAVEREHGRTLIELDERITERKTHLAKILREIGEVLGAQCDQADEPTQADDDGRDRLAVAPDSFAINFDGLDAAAHE